MAWTDDDYALGRAPTPEAAGANREIEAKFEIHHPTTWITLSNIEGRLDGILSHWERSPRAQQVDTYWRATSGGIYRVRQQAGCPPLLTYKEKDRGDNLDRLEKEEILLPSEARRMAYIYGKGRLVKAISTWEAVGCTISLYLIENRDPQRLYLEIEGGSLRDVADLTHHLSIHLGSAIHLREETRSNYEMYIAPAPTLDDLSLEQTGGRP